MTTITAEGLLLRPFEGRDAPTFTSAACESAQTVGRWMPWCRADYTSDDALEWFAVCRQGLEAQTAYEFGIFSEDGEEFLGGAGLNQLNRQHALCNLGYWVRSSRQRQHIASRCVAQKSGATLECVARNRLLIRGVSVPASVFSLVP